MRMVRCYACGKRYDYDEDGFCPGCGAFNQPERTSGPQELPRQKAPADRAAGPEAAKKLPKRRSGEKSGLHAGVEAGLDIALEALDSAVSPPPQEARAVTERAAASSRVKSFFIGKIPFYMS